MIKKIREAFENLAMLILVTIIIVGMLTYLLGKLLGIWDIIF